MSTPAETVVIAAARAVVAGTLDIPALAEALNVLDARDRGEEADITWGLVVAGDEMQHARTRAWHEVREVRTHAGRTTVRLAGVKDPITRPAATEITVRRSATGAAVDMFAAVLWSGPNGEKQ